MKTVINLAIQNILGQIDYINTNEDHLDAYYGIVPDLFTYNEERVKEVVITFIEKETTHTLDVLLAMEPELLTDLIHDIATNDYYYKLTRNHDSYGMLYDNDLFGIATPEEEIQIFDNCEHKLSEWTKNYIEHKTDTYISGDHAYITLHNSITVSLNVEEVLELINDTVADLIAEHEES